MLEPYEVKVSHAVLGGLGGGNIPRLPDTGGKARLVILSRCVTNTMKRQCNLCGLREDTNELVAKKKTWCLVFDKEVDNKQQNCKY
jgi:hypothetical protein